MYQYQSFDRQFLTERVAEFRQQVSRRLAGDLTEEEFRPLRLMNGLYLQLHAYMLRVAIPYGVLSTRQLRQLGVIAKKFDRSFGHFTTRQNIQFNWIKLIDTPDILAHLAAVDMHAIQTSGNCVRNVTTDPFAGVAADEYEDPRPWAEIMRQWSTLHPEFVFLPRKFKIAITGAKQDRAAIAFHDIGIRMVPNAANKGEIGFQMLVGGGQGRTPFVAQPVRDFLPKKYLLSYLEAMLRVYNMQGRRDNLYKARIKILVHEWGIDAYRQAIEEEWQRIKDTAFDLDADTKNRILADFAPVPLPHKDKNFSEEHLEKQLAGDKYFASWYRANIDQHRDPHYALVTLVLKDEKRMPGDATADEMAIIADLADEFSRGELRVSYIQNLVLPYVARSDLYKLYQVLHQHGLADGRKDYASDVICCPGLDYCSLANARSLPIAMDIIKAFAHTDLEDDLGNMRINMSGCINACGHHHSGHIGILGVDKKGVEAYQISIGGDPGDKASIGRVLGRAVSAKDIPEALLSFARIYKKNKKGDETFLATAERIGLEEFKEALHELDRSEKR
ncbi:MAG: nitrite/sulfite reductase [Alphaproteobacteria bacterium]|nr:nitrite/sulfite reductase [Alphaproteobacteria bacterium]